MISGILDNLWCVWRAATWVDKLFLILWPVAAAFHILSGDWLIAGFAIVVFMANFVVLQYKATATAWKSKYEAALAPRAQTFITDTRAIEVDEALRKERERRRSVGYGR